MKRGWLSLLLLAASHGSIVPAHAAKGQAASQPHAVCQVSHTVLDMYNVVNYNDPKIEIKMDIKPESWLGIDRYGKGEIVLDSYVVTLQLALKPPCSSAGCEDRSPYDASGILHVILRHGDAKNGKIVGEARVNSVGRDGKLPPLELDLYNIEVTQALQDKGNLGNPEPDYYAEATGFGSAPTGTISRVWVYCQLRDKNP